jgi:hypothetical protein
MHADPLLPFAKIIVGKINAGTNGRRISTRVTVRVRADFVSLPSTRMFSDIALHRSLIHSRLFEHHLEVFVPLGCRYGIRTRLSLGGSKLNRTVALPFPFAQGLAVIQIGGTVAACLAWRKGERERERERDE